MFSKMILDLGDNYTIETTKESDDIAIRVFHYQTIIGRAYITTDNVDVDCVTSLSLDNAHINHKFIQNLSLGEVLVKFLIKFPTLVRMPEFRFILNVPENFESIVAKYHFDRGVGTRLEDEIMVRNQIILPERRTSPENIEFTRAIAPDKMEDLLSFLKKNAYWQSHLTLERLSLLLTHSSCFFAMTKSGEIVGYSRVVTNNDSFASLWDVVVDESYRRMGIGLELMFQIFTNPSLSPIPNWILFTDTAKKLYEKFGFVSEKELPQRRLVHKLRLQESHPHYMGELMKIVEAGLPIRLTETQTFGFLCGLEGKRGNLSSFWQEVQSAQDVQITRADPRH